MDDWSWLVRYASRCAVAVFSAVVLSSSSLSVVAASAEDGCPAPSPSYQASSLPATISAGCNLQGALVQDYGVGVVVGPAGTGTNAEAITPDGVETLAVVTDADGTVHLLSVGDEVAVGLAATEAQATASSPPAACSDDYHILGGYHESDTHLWYFNRGTTPSGLAADSAERALRDAIINITHSDNDCGLADQVSATSNYGGNTSLRAEMDSSANCDGFLSRDGQNTVDFGDLPSNDVGFTCYWYWPITNELAEADSRLNKVEFNWTVTPGSGCSDKYDVESVMTHEWGHVYGLGDVSEADHGNLTMSARINGPCQASERTLGLGDVKGLRDLY